VSARAIAAALLALLALAPFAAVVSPQAASAQAGAAVEHDHDGDGVPDHGPAKARVEAGGELPEGQGFANSRAAALFFWVMAIAVIGGALFVITRRNMVSAVIGMVGTFFALAALYAMLYAHFLAAIQVLVYAGAIMVLFVFVVMILNRPEDEPWALRGLVGKGLAGLSLVYLVYRLASILWTVKDVPHAAEAPVIPGAFTFGSTKAVGKVLFTDYLFAFEAISIVLLVAVVGAIAIARPSLGGTPGTTDTPRSRH
jgi:NADH-quinone oxidoreductase subunit J